MATFRFQIYILAFCAGLLIPSSCHDYSGLQKNHAALFIFGDSVFDVGNNNYINTTIDFQSNFWPYGESYFRYPTGRFSDGGLIPDFIGNFTFFLVFSSAPGKFMTQPIFFFFKLMLQLSMQIYLLYRHVMLFDVSLKPH